MGFIIFRCTVYNKIAKKRNSIGGNECIRL